MYSKLKAIIFPCENRLNLLREEHKIALAENLKANREFIESQEQAKSNCPFKDTKVYKFTQFPKASYQIRVVD